MLAMLLVAVAMMKVNSVHAEPSFDVDLYSNSDRRFFNEEDMTPDSEQLKRMEREGETDKRGHSIRKHNPPPKIKSGRIGISEGKKRSPDEDVDIADREDHITQILADMFVNTDNEITSLQASEPEDAPNDMLIYTPNEKTDTFFEFLTSQERLTEVDGPSVELSR